MHLKNRRIIFVSVVLRYHDEIHVPQNFRSGVIDICGENRHLSMYPHRLKTVGI